MKNTIDTLYLRTPLFEKNGIPIFSERDRYVQNYENIAADHVAKITDNQENPFMEEELWVSLENSTRDYIKTYVPRGSRILDVGVGLGRLLAPLTEYERYGVDISLEYLSIAKTKGINVALSKIEDLPYTPNYFDAIVICDVLEHVFDLNDCCKKIIDCLRPGGVLIIRVPYKEDLHVYLRDDLPYEFIHMRNFDEPSIRLFFEKILGMTFLRAETTTPYLQGTPRLKIQLLPDAIRKPLLEETQKHKELILLRNALSVSSESLLDWIYELKDKNRVLYDELAPTLLHGIEINAVFRKPDNFPSKLAIELVNTTSDLNDSNGADDVSEIIRKVKDELISIQQELLRQKRLFPMIEKIDISINKLGVQIASLSSESSWVKKIIIKLKALL